MGNADKSNFQLKFIIIINGADCGYKYSYYSISKNRNNIAFIIAN